MAVSPPLQAPVGTRALSKEHLILSLNSQRVFINLGIKFGLLSLALKALLFVCLLRQGLTI
jgi:hypothetical protein